MRGPTNKSWSIFMSVNLSVFIRAMALQVQPRIHLCDVVSMLPASTRTTNAGHSIALLNRRHPLVLQPMQETVRYR
jgi:hypothetical protein